MIIKSVKNGNYLIAVSGLEIEGFEVSSLLGSINELSNETGITLQLFDSSLIATWEHLFFSALNALKAFNYGKNISNNLSVECLLYTSGQRQISIAVKNFGVNAETKDIGIILIGDDINLLQEVFKKILLITKGSENDAVLSINSKDKFEKIRNFFQITEIELKTICGSDEWTSCIEALIKYCIERSSLLVLQK